MRYIKLFEENEESRTVVALDPNDFVFMYDIKCYTEDTLPRNCRSEYNNMKFRIGDSVVYKEDGKKYIIDAIELPYGGTLNYHIENDKTATWVEVDEILPEIEADAKKYNM